MDRLDMAKEDRIARTSSWEGEPKGRTPMAKVTAMFGGTAATSGWVSHATWLRDIVHGVNSKGMEECASSLKREGSLFQD